MTIKLIDIEKNINLCNRCKLSETRKNTVPGQGPLSSLIMFIGDTPGNDEDSSGLPFVGESGQLFTKILSSVNIKREDVYITNIIKCFPQDNREPENNEMKACFPFLASQIEIISPKLIVTLGRISTQFLLDIKNFSITKEHGKMYSFYNIPLIPIYHPAYLLHSTSRNIGSPRYEMWEDIKKIKTLYDNILKIYANGEKC